MGEDVKDSGWRNADALQGAGRGGRGESEGEEEENSGYEDDEGDEGEWGILDAAGAGDTDWVREWLELDAQDRLAGGGGYADGRGWEGVRDQLGNTPLHLAAFGGHLDTVEMLLAAGLEEELEEGATMLTNFEEDTPLHMAVLSASLEVVQALADDRSAKAVNVEGFTPLHYAAGEGYADIVGFLLECGADASARDALGLTPCFCAVLQSKLEVALRHRIVCRRGGGR
ncbi:ankyrin repeat-containing domain protein [Baffinella frigidus]|nr:ankyrin repeat-containing domain protein [Cryptophyta sp. CCMP2293]